MKQSTYATLAAIAALAALAPQIPPMGKYKPQPKYASPAQQAKRARHQSRKGRM